VLTWLFKTIAVSLLWPRVSSWRATARWQSGSASEYLPCSRYVTAKLFKAMAVSQLFGPSAVSLQRRDVYCKTEQNRTPEIARPYLKSTLACLLCLSILHPKKTINQTFKCVHATLPCRLCSHARRVRAIPTSALSGPLSDCRYRSSQTCFFCIVD